MIAGGDDVFDFVADMMHAAGRVLFEERGDRRGFAERLEQFDLGVADVDEDDGDPMLGKRLRRGHLGAQRLAIDGGGGGEVRHGDGDVVEASEHVLFLMVR